MKPILKKPSIIDLKIKLKINLVRFLPYQLNSVSTFSLQSKLIKYYIYNNKKRKVKDKHIINLIKVRNNKNRTVIPHGEPI